MHTHTHIPSQFWEGGHQGGGSGASTLFVALEEGVLMRYDLREPGWHGEEVIARRGRGAIKAVAIPDRDNFARGVSPWMLCVGGVDARCVFVFGFVVLLYVCAYVCV